MAASGGDFESLNGGRIGGGSITNVTFFSAANVGGFDDGSVVADVINNDQLCTGSEAHPVFAVGAYQSGPAALTISDGVPEPATWAMMLLGVGGPGASLRSRRKAAFAAV